MSFLGPFVGLVGMLHGLPGMFVSGLMIFFSVMHRSTAVRVRREFVELGSPLVRFIRIWHSGLSLASLPT